MRKDAELMKDVGALSLDVMEDDLTVEVDAWTRNR